jgi:secondary thiamine-phosphate synthase enzyme
MSGEATRQASAERQQPRLQALQVETHGRVEFQDITGVIQKVVEESRVEQGVCHIFVPHTTAALLINENDDRALQKDLDNFLKGLAPDDREYFHNDGNCDAHLKAALIGCSKTVLVENGRLVLGRWQGIFFCEFDGPRRRDLRVKVVAD